MMQINKISHVIAMMLMIVFFAGLSECIIEQSFFVVMTIELIIILTFVITHSLEFTIYANKHNYDLASKKNLHLQKLQALGKLSSTIAHDFNNILAVIIGYSDLLLVRHINDEKSFIDTNQIKCNAIRASNLVRQLLSFAKKTEIQPKDTDINLVITQLESFIARLIGHKMTLSIQTTDIKAISCVDITQVEQVIINLVINAKDAMNNIGALVIHTNVITVDHKFDTSAYYNPMGAKKIAPGRYVQISVSDSGTGIDLEIIDKIFEPFFSTKDTEAAIGLGLATVLQIIEKMKGYIFVHTKAKEGTIFHIFLKAANKENIPFNALNDDRKFLHSELTQEKKNYTILVVEDEDSLRVFNANILKDIGYNVIAVRGAEEAMDVVKNQKQHIDLLFSDVDLGAMDGPVLAQALKQYNKQLKIILTSGYDKNSIAHADINKYLFLSKPYTLKELITVINKVQATI